MITSGLRLSSLLLLSIQLLSGCSSGHETFGGVDDISVDTGADATFTPVTDSCSAVVAGAVVEGDVTIQNSLDVNDVLPFSAITGSLVVDAAGLTRLSLPNLEVVNGALIIRNSGNLQEISLPKLRWAAAGISIVGSPNVTAFDLGELCLTDKLLIAGAGDYAGSTDELPAEWKMPLRFPKLTTASMVALMATNTPEVDLSSLAEIKWHEDAADFYYMGDLKISNHPGLTNVKLPSLTSVAAELSVFSAPTLDSVDIPQLVEVGMLSIGGPVTHLPISQLERVTGRGIIVGGTLLTSISLPNLTSFGPGDFDDQFFSINNNPNLESVSVGSQFVSAGLASVDFKLNPKLTSISVPALTSSGSLKVMSNPSLTSLALPAFQRALAYFWVVNNESLPQCQVDTLRGQLAEEPFGSEGLEGVRMFGNSDVCP